MRSSSARRKRHGQGTSGPAVHDPARADKPYVKVHCAALSPHLLESELFGHVKGAFTGAHRDKIGRFELADGGTLFLDEIGDISLEVQTKLLRVLQEKTFERVGSSETVYRRRPHRHCNASKPRRADPPGAFSRGSVYRLNVFPIQVPSLREGREDIPELVLFFVQQASHAARRISSTSRTRRWPPCAATPGRATSAN